VAERQQAAVDDLGGQLRRPELCHRGLGTVLQTVVLHPQCFEADEEGTAHVGGALCEREGNTLEGADRLAEGDPVAGPLQGLVQICLGSAKAALADDGP
jgi:hypothetical protein